MIGIPLGIAYANGVEALFHRYVLHGIGKNPKSFWAFHWREHHRAARRNDFYDAAYETYDFTTLNAQTKELLAIAGGVVVHLPIAPIAPFFVATLAVCGVRYHLLHRKGHLDPEWAKEHMRWHYDHHMGPNQDANWGIVRPWYDDIAGTREHYSP